MSPHLYLFLLRRSAPDSCASNSSCVVMASWSPNHFHRGHKRVVPSSSSPWLFHLVRLPSSVLRRDHRKAVGGSCAAAASARTHWCWGLECESDTFADAPLSLPIPHPGRLSAKAGLIAHQSRVFSTDPPVAVASLL